MLKALKVSNRQCNRFYVSIINNSINEDLAGLFGFPMFILTFVFRVVSAFIIDTLTGRSMTTTGVSTSPTTTTTTKSDFKSQNIRSGCHRGSGSHARERLLDISDARQEGIRRQKLLPGSLIVCR